VLQVCEKRKIFGFGYGADMSRFAPNAQLTASLDLWGPYYIGRARAMLDGSWTSDDVWGGMKEGFLGIAPYNKVVPDNVRTAGDKIIALTKAGLYEVFAGPIADQSGKERVAKGQRIDDKDLLAMDWYVKGVQS
jgi:basic membrane protein A and related proteins